MLINNDLVKKLNKVRSGLESDEIRLHELETIEIVKEFKKLSSRRQNAISKIAELRKMIYNSCHNHMFVIFNKRTKFSEFHKKDYEIFDAVCLNCEIKLKDMKIETVSSGLYTLRKPGLLIQYVGSIICQINQYDVSKVIEMYDSMQQEGETIEYIIDKIRMSYKID